MNERTAAGSQSRFLVYRSRPREPSDCWVAGFDKWEQARAHARALNEAALIRHGRPTAAPFVIYYAQRKFGTNPGPEILADNQGESQ
jgi:hypothetical protein